MQNALAKLERLLRSYHHDYEANLASIALALYATDPLAACQSINTAQWWEDSQSIASIDLAVSGGFTAQARHDARALREALIDIFTTLRAYGEHNEAGEIIVSQFRKWSESHV